MMSPCFNSFIRDKFNYFNNGLTKIAVPTARTLTTNIKEKHLLKKGNCISLRFMLRQFIFQKICVNLLLFACLKRI